MAITKDTLLLGLPAASGGKPAVKYNVNGDPLMMVRIPKFNLEDIDAALGAGPHPMFVVNGIVKSEVYIGMCQAILEKGCALSIPGLSPKVSITFDQAKVACVANGPGFHLMTAWEWAGVALWCLKNGFQLRGNTNYLKSHKAGYETGTPAPARHRGDTTGRIGGSPIWWAMCGNGRMGLSPLTGGYISPRIMISRCLKRSGRQAHFTLTQRRGRGIGTAQWTAGILW